MRSSIRKVLRLGLLLPLSLGWYLASCLPASRTGFAYLLGVSLLCAAAWPTRARRGLLFTGLAILLLALFTRGWVASTREDVRVAVFPGGTEVRLLNTVIAERDGALLAALALRASGRFNARQTAELLPALRAAYARLNDDPGIVASPAMATYLGLQSPRRFDAVVVEPQGPIRAAAIFLHGYAGNFTLHCVEFSRSLRQAGVLVVCPSSGLRGAFWSPRGRKVIESTLRYVQARGARRVYLGGLSNGAVGASLQAPAFERQLSGLVLVSGVSPQARPVRVPTLVIQGDRDDMAPASRARTYVRAGGPRMRYVELEGGHFVFLSQHDRIRRTLRDWFDTALKE